MLNCSLPQIWLDPVRADDEATYLLPEKFAQTQHKIMPRHVGVVTNMAQGILENKRK